MLRGLFTYRLYSDHQMRRIIRAALKDPSTGKFLEVKLNAPTDWVLGETLRSVLPNLREVVVIPSLDPIAPSNLPTFLGKTAAKVFAPRFLGGQRIGLGYGPAIYAFVNSLHIPPFLIEHLYFESLVFCPHARIWGVGSENLFKFVSDNVSRLGEQLNCFVRPTQLTSNDLHWAFVEINRVDERLGQPPFTLNLKALQQCEPVAEILTQLVNRNGALIPLTISSIWATPLKVLRDMVRNGRGVVALVGGSQNVQAVLAAYRAGLFNYLVTDELCAEMLLKSQHPDWRVSDLPYRDEWWERKQHFYVALLRYGQPTPKTVKEIAQQLTLSPKRVRILLNNLHRGGSHEPMITIRVKAPSPEMDLEMNLIKLLGLSEVRVVTEGDIQELGNVAAQLFWDLARGQTNFSVGISSGQMVKAMMHSLNLPTSIHKFHIKSLNFWALDINPLPKVSGFSAETILASVAMEWLSLEGDSSTVQFHVYRGGQPPNLDAVFVELDALADELTNFLSHQPNEALHKLSPVTGVTSSQKRINGGSTLSSPPNRTLALFPLTELRKMVDRGKPVVVIAKGEEKSSSLLAAYKNNLLNGLVIDRILAEALLNHVFR